MHGFHHVGLASHLDGHKQVDMVAFMMEHNGE